MSDQHALSTRRIQLLENAYCFSIYSIHCLGEEYLLQTNQGRFRLSCWQFEPYVYWSWRWREEMVQLGMRQVDRFIHTCYGTPYLEDAGAHFVVQDDLNLPPLSSIRYRRMEEFGTYVGLLYTAFANASENVNMNYRHVPHFLTDKQYAVLLANLQHQLAVAHTPFSTLVINQWEQLEMRWKRSFYIWRKSRMETGATNVLWSLRNLECSNWRELEQGNVYFQALPRSPSVGFSALVQVMLQVAENDDDSLQQLSRFYQSFYNTYRPNYSEELCILSYLVLPSSLLKTVVDYVQKRVNEQESMRNWMNGIGAQQVRDDVQQWFAAYLDRKRAQGNAHLRTGRFQRGVRSG